MKEDVLSVVTADLPNADNTAILKKIRRKSRAGYTGQKNRISGYGIDGAVPDI